MTDFALARLGLRHWGCGRADEIQLVKQPARTKGKAGRGFLEFCVGFESGANRCGGKGSLGRLSPHCWAQK
jgi:hypothetical protein